MSMSHLKFPASKSIEETLATKNWRDYSHIKCWTQVYLLLRTVFTFFVKAHLSKSNGNRRKWKIRSRKQGRLLIERISNQVQSLPTSVHYLFKYHDRVTVSSNKSWFRHYWDRIRGSFERPVIGSSLLDNHSGICINSQCYKQQVLSNTVSCLMTTKSGILLILK